MSRSLKPTWPFSSRWIFHSDARIASPACSREMPLSVRSRRSCAPTSIRRTVGPLPACTSVTPTSQRPLSAHSLPRLSAPDPWSDPVHGKNNVDGCAWKPAGAGATAAGGGTPGRRGRLRSPLGPGCRGRAPGRAVGCLAGWWVRGPAAGLASTDRRARAGWFGERARPVRGQARNACVGLGARGGDPRCGQPNSGYIEFGCDPFPSSVGADHRGGPRVGGDSERLAVRLRAVPPARSEGRLGLPHLDAAGRPRAAGDLLGDRRPRRPPAAAPVPAHRARPRPRDGAVSARGGPCRGPGWTATAMGGRMMSSGRRPALCPEPPARLDRDQRLLGAYLQLLHGPGVAVRVGEAEEGAAVLVAERGELARLDAAADQLLAGGRGIGHHELQALHRTGSISRWPGRSPKTIEQPEPRGVSCTTCMCSLVVSWSSSKPTWSR